MELGIGRFITEEEVDYTAEKRMQQVQCICTGYSGDTFHHPLGCLNFSFAYVEGESLLMALKDVALSSGRSVITQRLKKILKYE